MNLPFISCICPTYKRPKLLANAIACFVGQDYPLERRELIILDDAGQFQSQLSSQGWSVISTEIRFPDLPSKFRELVKLCSGNVIAVWEDDDIYLPHHLESIAKAFQSGGPEYYVPNHVYSTYGKPFGHYQTELAAGRFHASWAFTRSLYAEVGGYPKTTRLDFDQQMRDRLSVNGRNHYDADGPSYVYRWGNGIYHGSQSGEDGFRDLWERIGNMPFEPIDELVPKFDKQTELIFEKLMIPL